MKILEDQKNNRAFLVAEDESRPWDKIRDYDEYLGNSISLISDRSHLRNFRTDNLSGEFTMALKLDDQLEIDLGTYLTDFATDTKQRWLMEMAAVEGTHNSNILVDYNNISWKIWNDRWKPTLLNHIKHFQEAANDSDDVASEIFNDFFNDLISTINFKASSNCDLFEGFHDNIREITDYHAEYNSGYEHAVKAKEYLTDWVNYLTNWVERQEEENFSTEKLDVVITYFHEMDMYNNNFSLAVPEHEPALDTTTLIQNTLMDLYFKYNPHMGLITVQDNRYNYSVSLERHENISYEDFYNASGIILLSNPEEIKSLETQINQFLNGDFYVATEITIITDENKDQYPIADVEVFEGVHYITTGDTIGGFESEEAILAGF